MVPAYLRSHGALALEFAQRGGTSVLRRRQEGGCLRVRVPRFHEGRTAEAVVINTSGELSGQAKTVSTDGAIVSVLIADKGTGDQLYLFPETKQEASYKTFKWSTWEKVSYTVREKDGFALMEKYFSGK